MKTQETETEGEDEWTAQEKLYWSKEGGTWIQVISKSVSEPEDQEQVYITEEDVNAEEEGAEEAQQEGEKRRDEQKKDEERRTRVREWVEKSRERGGDWKNAEEGGKTTTEGDKWCFYTIPRKKEEYLSIRIARQDVEDAWREEATKKETTDAEGSDFKVYTMYKPVGKKVLPVAQPFGKEQTTRLHQPPYSRDPYQTPLTADIPTFEPGGRLTQERVDQIDFGPEGWLTPAERNLVLHVLRLREKALAGAPEERGCLKSTWADPVKVATVPHTPWKERPIPLPAALRDQITELLDERMATGLYESSTSAYSGRWFVVKKKDGKLRIVHDLQPLNAVTIRNSGNPPVAEEFIESFAGRMSYALMDIFGGYDQFPIDEEYRDLTTFQTTQGPKRLTRLPQGATNSVQEFQRMMEWIFRAEIPHALGVFIDDCGMKGAAEDYGNEKMEWNAEIRRWVWEHCITLERQLFRLEEAGLTASIKKLQACVPVAEILGTRVSKEGTSITEGKLNKIARFPEPRNTTEARSWLGLLTYVRHYIPDFGNIVRPIRALTKKDAEWEWTEDCEKSFVCCKEIVGNKIMLRKLDYSPGAGEIILSVDSSSTAAGGALWQVRQDGLKEPVRYESISFTDMESRYSQPKLELAGVVKMLKKLKRLLWGVHFILEIDALFLIQMINNPDLPNAAMTRWIAYIHLFDFEIRHVAGKKHTFADALSRVRRTESDDSAESVGTLMSGRSGFAVGLTKAELGARDRPKVMGVYLAEGEYEGEWKELGEYLETGEKKEGLDDRSHRRATQRAHKFLVRNGRLYRRQDNEQHQEVVMSPARRRTYLEQVHDEGGHRGRDETYRRVKLRAWWPNMEKDVREYVKTCDTCQKHNHVQEREKSAITLPAGLFSKIHFDCVYLKQGLYFVSATDDLSGWIDARILKNLKSRTCARFLDEEIISRYGQFGQATIDGGAEFKKEFRAVLSRAGIEYRVIAPYHPEANSRAERGHPGLVKVLAKLCTSYKDVYRVLPKALAAHRISTSRSSGFSPFELVFGVHPVLPIDMQAATWLTVQWDEVKTREQLLEERIKLMDAREELWEEAKEKMRRSREASIAYLDKVNAHRIRDKLEEGQLVLVVNQLKLDTHTQKLNARWHGPYSVVARLAKGSYLLSEVDGTVIARAYAAKRLRRYHARGISEEVLEEVGVAEEGSEGDHEEEDREEARKEAKRQNDYAIRLQNARRRFLGVFIPPNKTTNRRKILSTKEAALAGNLTDDSPERGSLQ